MSTVDKEKLERIRELLTEADRLGVDRAEFLLRYGVEPHAIGRWLKDETYTGESKDVFICSNCLHWQSVKKLKPDQVMYMKYCPFCGAKMEV